MLTTSLSQDLYKRFLRPEASDARVLAVARWATVISGAAGVALAWSSEDVIETLQIFYALLSVGLFVPIVGGLYVGRTSNRVALTSVAAGLSVMLIDRVLTSGAKPGLVTPAIAGLLAAISVWAIMLPFSKLSQTADR
jgi:SSS family solute:Na+ symporter